MSNLPTVRRYVVVTWNGIHETSHIVPATTPDEAMTTIERTGLEYTDAEVRDEHGQQLAVYGPPSEHDLMHTCPHCGAEMLYWQQAAHDRDVCPARVAV